MNLLALLAGKPKKGPDDDQPMDEGSPMETYAHTAYSALKDDDEDGFVSALTAMVKCGSKPDDDEMEPDADDEG